MSGSLKTLEKWEKTGQPDKPEKMKPEEEQKGEMKLLTVKEVAAMFKAKPSTVYGWAEQRLIPSFRINGLLRFSEEAILEWLKTCQMTPETRIINSAGRRPGREGR